MKNLKLLLLLIPSFAFSARGPSDPLPPGYLLFPSSNVWNTEIAYANVSSSNTLWMDPTNGHTLHNAHMDFGINFAGQLNGIPYNLVYSTDAHVTPTITIYAGESDAIPVGGLPLPSDVIAEGDPGPVGGPYVDNASSDKHLIGVWISSNIVFELNQATRTAGGNWTADQFTLWYSSSNALRPDGYTSADAAGLPIFPGLVRYDEVKSGHINHALRFTLSLTHGPHIWPGRHDANTGGVLNPPFGMRVRMKASYDCSSKSADFQVICTALKTYGAFMADNGGDWFFSGAPNPSWDFSTLHDEFAAMIPFNVFEVVDESTWIVDPNSAEARSPIIPPTQMTGSVQIR